MLPRTVRTEVCLSSLESAVLQQLADEIGDRSSAIRYCIEIVANMSERERAKVEGRRA